jgi:YD repeat-containing protein
LERGGHAGAGDAADGQDVFFTYDALGRRLSKTYRHKTTRWVWDGNVPLHEWTEKRLFTQVYADDDRIAGALRGNAQCLIRPAPVLGRYPMHSRRGCSSRRVLRRWPS